MCRRLVPPERAEGSRAVRGGPRAGQHSAPSGLVGGCPGGGGAARRGLPPERQSPEGQSPGIFHPRPARANSARSCSPTAPARSPAPRGPPHPSDLTHPYPSRSRAPRAGRRRRLPSPLSRTDSLLFCASARFLWRGRSRDSSRARASAPCISPMTAGRGARSGRRRPANTDVSLKEPP